MVVEFFGLPGVGKSSLSRQVGEILNKQGFSVGQITYALSHKSGRLERISRKLIYIAREFFFNPRYIISSIDAIVATRQKTIADFLKLLFNWIFVSSVIRKDNSSIKIQLVDQGIFQALWSIGFSARNKTWLKEMSARQPQPPKPNIIVIIEADVQLIKQRLARREHHDSRIEKLSEIDLTSLNHSLSLFEEIKSSLWTTSDRDKSNGSNIIIRVFKNEKSDDLKKIATIIAQDIRKITSKDNSNNIT